MECKQIMSNMLQFHILVCDLGMAVLTIEKCFCTNNCDAVMYAYQPSIEMIIQDFFFFSFPSLLQYSTNKGGRGVAPFLYHLICNDSFCNWRKVVNPKLLCKFWSFSLVCLEATDYRISLYGKVTILHKTSNCCMGLAQYLLKMNYCPLIVEQLCETGNLLKVDVIDSCHQ